MKTQHVTIETNTGKVINPSLYFKWFPLFDSLELSTHLVKDGRASSHLPNSKIDWEQIITVV